MRCVRVVRRWRSSLSDTRDRPCCPSARDPRRRRSARCRQRHRLADGCGRRGVQRAPDGTSPVADDRRGEARAGVEAWKLLDLLAAHSRTRRRDIGFSTHRATGHSAGGSATISTERRGSGLATDPDEALRGAIKTALDAGLYERATALLDVLKKTGAPAEVVDLRERRKT